ncbi:MAG: PLDc N-terminal domain-containing protein [Flavobacteriaceae bacterium]|nr:PLDc N-terminal domain-containing protein [Flavobacteriaceae bacterium]
MEIKPLILPKKLLIALAGIGIAMIIGTFYAAAQGQHAEIKWLISGFIISFVPFVAVILDLSKNPVKNKMIWVLILFTISMLGCFIYLILRDQIMTDSNINR